MCLIAYRSIPGSHIPNDVIDYNIKSNPDGFGLAWRAADGVKFMKFGPEDAEKFRQYLKEIDKTDMVYAAHWRTGTAGPNSKELAHPFPYKDKDGNDILAFHNGIIDIKTPAGESDTSAFVDGVLSGLPYGWWDDTAISYLVESAIGWSRILIMTEAEDIFINEGQWRKDGGIMYSTMPIFRGITKPTATGITTPTSPTLGYLPAVTAGGKAYRAAKNLDNNWEDEDDDYADFLIKSRKKNKRSTMPIKFYHKGHSVTPVTQIDSSSDGEDRYGVVKCDECCTDGEYFVIEGVLQIDLDHMSDLLYKEM